MMRNVPLDCIFTVLSLINLAGSGRIRTDKLPCSSSHSSFDLLVLSKDRQCVDAPGISGGCESAYIDCDVCYSVLTGIQ